MPKLTSMVERETLASKFAKLGVRIKIGTVHTQDGGALFHELACPTKDGSYLYSLAAIKDTFERYRKKANETGSDGYDDFLDEEAKELLKTSGLESSVAFRKTDEFGKIHAITHVEIVQYLAYILSLRARKDKKDKAEQELAELQKLQNSMKTPKEKRKEIEERIAELTKEL